MTIQDAIAQTQTALATLQAIAAVPDIQQNSTVPDQDWLEGTPATINVLGNYSSPSGKTLTLSGSGLPTGVTVSGGSLAYDGTGKFENAIPVAIIYPGVTPPSGAYLSIAAV